MILILYILMKLATFGFVALLIICWTFDPFLKKIELFFFSLKVILPQESPGSFLIFHEINFVS